MTWFGWGWQGVQVRFNTSYHLNKPWTCTYRLSSPHPSRNNTKPQVKHAFATLCTEIAKYGGFDDCSIKELEACVASAQAIENHAMHAKTRFSPYMVSKHIISPTLCRYPRETESVDALTPRRARVSHRTRYTTALRRHLRVNPCLSSDHLSKHEL